MPFKTTTGGALEVCRSEMRGLGDACTVMEQSVLWEDALTT